MLTNIELYFLHGWGFENKIWNNWLPKINNGIAVNIFDRGYFKNKKYDFQFNFSARAKILIAHSFGLHYLSPKDFNQIHMLILISGFRYFHEHTENKKFSQKQIELMKQKLLTDPTDLITNFHLRTGLTNIDQLSPIINRELLYDDLVLLDKQQIDIDNLKAIPKIIFLHGAQDKIIKTEHSVHLHKQLPQSKLFINNEEGHALPLTAPAWCMNIIQTQLNKKIFAV